MKTIPLSLLLGIAISTMGSSGAENTDHRTAEIKLTHQLAREAVGYHEICAQMAATGIDFPVLLQHALDGTETAIKLLIWSAENLNWDGAPGEGFGYIMVAAAKLIGDERMTSAAKTMENQKFEATRSYLRFEFMDVDENEEVTQREILKTFPKFWREISKKAE